MIYAKLNSGKMIIIIIATPFAHISSILIMLIRWKIITSRVMQIRNT